MSKTALNRYKKQISKKFKNIKKWILENKKKSIILASSISIIFISLGLFLILKPKINDDIFVLDSNNPALYANINPNFEVNFGQKEDPEKQWIRFESDPTINNPFASEKPNFFKKIINNVIPKKSLGVEMSLIGLEVDETKSKNLNDYDSKVQTVAEILGTEEVETSTALIEMGREIGVYEDDQIISKETIVNESVSDGIDLEYQILAGIGLKEEIVLQSLEAFGSECLEDVSKCQLPLNQYTFDLKLDEGVVLKEGLYTVKGKTTTSYYFENEKGEYLSHFLPSFAIDGSGMKTYDVDLKIEEVDGYNYEIVVTVDLDWLLSSERTFPIRIDPSIVHDSEADFSGGIYDNTVFDTSEIRLSLMDYDPIENTLVLYHMDESGDNSCSDGSDVCNDASSSYNGIVSGSASIVDGVRNSARYFDGVDDYIDIGSGLSDFTNGFTISFWAKPTASTYYARFFDFGESAQSGNGNIVLYRLDTSNSLYFDVGNGSTTQHITVTDGIINNEWHHYAITLDSSGYAKVYRDSKIIGSQSLLVPANVSRTHNYIGKSNWSAGDPLYKGYFDEFEIANTAYSDSKIEELYLKTGYKYFGEYNSSILDFESSSAGVNSFSWLDSGVGSGDGEIPYSTTGLVAQWNFNETSGTVASNVGSCGSACNGTVINAVTTGQDDNLSSGWTYNDRKWGEGAIRLDGSNDYINYGGNSSMNVGGADFTWSAWIKPDTLSNWSDIYTQESSSPATSGGSVMWEYMADGSLQLAPYGLGASISNPGVIQKGVWQYVVVTFDSATLESTFYVNGQNVGSGSHTGNWSFTLANAATGARYINAGTVTGSFDGSIDVLQVFTRKLSESEIQTNYQTGNIEFQYRYSDDGVTWTDWEGGSSKDLDSITEYTYDDILVDTLIRYDFEEESGTTVIDQEGNYDGLIVNNTARVAGKIGNGIYFDGVDDYLYIGDVNEMDAPTTFTVGMWFNRTTDNSGTANDTGHLVNNILLAQSSTAENDNLEIGTEGSKLEFYVDTAGTDLIGADGGTVDVGLANNEWHHLVVSLDYRSGAEFKAYFDGELVYAYQDGSMGLASSAGSPINLGLSRPGGDSWGDYNGYLDEFFISTEVLSPVDIQRLYTYGSNDYISSIHDSSLVLHYDLDETTGDLAGTDFYDSSGYGNNGEIYGTNLAGNSMKGVMDSARDFNGSDDFINTASSNIPAGVAGSDVAVSFWINADSFSTETGLICKGGSSTGFDWVVTISSGKIWVRTNGGNNGGTSATLSTNTWYHVVATWGAGAGHIVYVNGVAGSFVSTADTSSSTDNNVYVGKSMNNGTPNYAFFNGTLDDVRIYDRILSEYEIDELVRESHTSYEDTEILDTNINGYTNLEYSVASTGDTQAIYGESEFANYQPDSNTLGVWHFEEIEDNTCYGGDDSCNSASNNYHGINSGNLETVSGQLGESKYFDGSSNYITLDSGFTNFTTGLTVSFWANPTASNNYARFIDFGGANGTGNANIIVYRLGTTSSLNFYTGNGTSAKAMTVTNAIINDEWHYYTITLSSSGTGKVYRDGIEIGSDSSMYIPANTSRANCYIGKSNWADELYEGYLDEVRIDNIARTSEEIRSAYQIGSRLFYSKFPFKADLQSSNLISNSGDTSFTISETTYGSINEIENLFKYDNIIIREIVNGVEYIAEGTVLSVDEDTGAVSVSSWTSESTFPSGGYSVYASVFKWETKYLSLNSVLDEFKDNISLVSVSKENINELLWVKDIKASRYIDSDLTNTKEQLSTLDTGSSTIIHKEGTASELLTSSSLNINMTAKDLTGYTRIPFWIAGDNIGSISATYGESAHSNYASDENTVGFWHLDDTGSTAVDSSDYNQTATLVGTTVSNNESYLESSKYFDGSSYINITNSASLNPTSEFTLSAWVNRDVMNVQHSVIEKYNWTSGNGSYILRITSGNVIQGYVINGTTYSTCTGTTVINSGSWYYIAVTFDTNTNTLSCYVNGELDSSNTSATVNPVVSTNPLRIGCRGNDLGTKFQGYMDEVKIDNVARTEKEILDAYEYGKDGRTQEFNVDFKADLQSSNLISDSSDLSFDISEINYGSYSAVENLQVGDTIILSEDMAHLEMTSSTPVEGANNYYVYQKAFDGSSIVLHTGDTFEYDVMLDHNIDQIGGVDLQFTDATYARGTAGWEDQNGITCHPNGDISSYAYNTWFTRKCTVPSAFNGKMISFVSLVDEGSETTVTTSYDNFVVKDNSGNIKSILYLKGDSDYDTVHLSNSGSAQINPTSVDIKSAQGIVGTIDANSGSITVDSWNASSTFATRGYTIGASVFKWQKEYIDLRLTSDRANDTDAVTDITFRKLNGSTANIWIDDIQAGEDLAFIEGTPRYFQYRSIFTTTDSNFTPALSSVTIDYLAPLGPTNEQLMRHGQWIDPTTGQKQGFWWIGEH
jgi:hypothetical protein